MNGSLYKLGGPFLRCPGNESLSVFCGSILEPLMFWLDCQVAVVYESPYHASEHNAGDLVFV